jgi:hypothetical protein
MTRATPPPENLPVTDKLKDWAKSHIPDSLCLNLQTETEKFLEKSRAQGWIYIDWEAGRRSWLLKAVEFAGERVASGNNSHPKGSNANAASNRNNQPDRRPFPGAPKYVPGQR